MVVEARVTAATRARARAKARVRTARNLVRQVLAKVAGVAADLPQQQQQQQDGSKRKLTKDYPGSDLKDIPENSRCCMYWHYVDGHGVSRCQKYANGEECTAKHLDNIPKAMKSSKIANKLKTLYGEPNGPPKKGEGRKSGKS